MTRRRLTPEQRADEADIAAEYAAFDARTAAHQGFLYVQDPDDPGFEVTIGYTFGLVPIAGRHALPKYFSAAWNSPPFPPCELNFETETDGQVVCRRFTVSARVDDRTRSEVTLAGLRNIRIGELKRRAIRLAMVEMDFTGSRIALRHPALGDQIDDPPDAIWNIEQRAHRPRRGKKLSDAHLQEVAEVYREALSLRKPPTKAVMQHFFTARANAGRWVAEARKRGFLGKAEAPRRAGEKQKPKRAKRGESHGKR